MEQDVLHTLLRYVTATVAVPALVEGRPSLTNPVFQSTGNDAAHVIQRQGQAQDVRQSGGTAWWLDGTQCGPPVARRVRLNGESKKQALHNYGVLQDPKSDV